MWLAIYRFLARLLKMKIERSFRILGPLRAKGRRSSLPSATRDIFRAVRTRCMFPRHEMQWILCSLRSRTCGGTAMPLSAIRRELKYFSDLVWTLKRRLSLHIQRAELAVTPDLADSTNSSIVFYTGRYF